MDYNGLSLTNLLDRTDELTSYRWRQFCVRLGIIWRRRGGRTLSRRLSRSIYQIVPEPNSLAVLCASGCGVSSLVAEAEEVFGVEAPANSWRK